MEGFSQWRAFEPGVHKSAPSEKGVYILRRKNRILFLKDGSDIVYVGSASNYDGLQMQP